MNTPKLSLYFRRSCALGITGELTNYGLMLLCGYGTSHLLELVMAGEIARLPEVSILVLLILFLGVVPRYLLILLRSRFRLEDIQRFREFLYACVLDRRIQAADRGEMSVRMNGDTKTIAGFFQETVPKTISGVIVMLCSTVLLMLTDWRIGGIFFLLNMTQLIPILVYEKWTRQIYNQTHSDEEDYCAWMLEGYNGIETIKSYGVEGWFMARYWKLNRAIVRSGRLAEQVGTVESMIFSAIDSLLNYGSYIIIGLFVLYGGLDVARAPILVVLAGYLFSSISSVFDLRLEQFQYQEAVSRLGFRENGEITENGSEILSVRNLCKSYEGKQVLTDVSFTIRNGEKVHLSGENGSGKTTLLRLILDLEDADKGKIKWGIPANARAVSLQEEPELSATAAELMNAMSDAVDSKQMAAHLDAFRIFHLLEKPINCLSPGERKKFYLSAALAHQGEMLILDEPTNHLDADSTAYLNRVLRESDKTMIVCAHGHTLNILWTKEIRMEGGTCHEAP